MRTEKKTKPPGDRHKNKHMSELNQEALAFVQDVTRVGRVHTALEDLSARQKLKQPVSVLTRNAHKALERAELEVPPMLKQTGSSKDGKEVRAVKINNFVWGPLLWNTNHMMAALYPENPTPQTQADAIAFYTSQASLLPCQDECGPGWQEELSKNPPDVSSRHALMEWLRCRHNAVNAKLGGAQYTRTDMLARVAEQQEALTAVVYYAKKEDYEALKAPLTLSARMSHEWTKLMEDPSVWVAIITGAILGLLMLILWVWSKACQ